MIEKGTKLRIPIIAGFPGIGKSTATKRYPELYIDLDSSMFHWLYDDEGNKYQDPSWPKNYIDAIKTIAFDSEDNPEFKDSAYIFVSTHEQILNLLKEENIPFVIVAPTIEKKAEYLRRYRDRGNDEEFIKNLDKNFEKFIKSLKNHKKPILWDRKEDFILHQVLDSHEVYNNILLTEQAMIDDMR